MKIGELHQYAHDATTTFYTNVVKGLKNTFPDDEIIHIESYQNLVESNIDVLFVINDHHNSCIYAEQPFIDYLNEKNIRVIFFNYEKIYNSFFPWNVSIQERLETIKNKYQFVSDIEDLELLSRPAPCKQFLSRSTEFNVTPIPWEQKQDRILFLGCIYNEQYKARLDKVNTLAQNTELQYPVDIVITNNTIMYKEFIEKLNSYKYVLNPFGTGMFVNIRHYEARHMGCVVLQEVTDKLLKYYPELNQTCIPFYHVNEIPNLLKAPFTPSSEIFIEDYFEQIQLKSYIIS
jgi:hypothetical protein